MFGLIFSCSIFHHGLIENCERFGKAGEDAEEGGDGKVTDSGANLEPGALILDDPEEVEGEDVAEGHADHEEGRGRHAEPPGQHPERR